jgi:hypothetical protein
MKMDYPKEIPKTASIYRNSLHALKKHLLRMPLLINNTTYS